ncbi:family 78 glycoside hydrolase catalytic domain [Lutibacter sp. A64]|uniref:alpha-L-rhamnosidase-related protein n=1 Tax=Lutibacter sp. A64 TaxID=2918526 RepID=UPI001F0637A1|nr:alpha-L-rhamnosidase C-terminal domain-containing protein [Lutibacter sp. A64]UMB53327.1 family 78 glycoside hydrolase catalytic domain [Lutibacter sp. A64]
MFLLFSCKSNYGIEDEENRPTGLSVEFIRQPETVLIIDQKPEFSWELPKTAVKQLSYQILIASSLELIENNKGDVWDSRKIVSGQSINIEFEGAPLEVGKTYFWKVKIWDAANKESLYSKFQSFRIGAKENIITSANSFQIESLKPVKFQKLNADSYFIDFGKAAFATLEFNYKTTKKDTLVFHIGEQLVENRINRKPKGTIRYQKIKVPVNPEQKKYTLSIKPDKRNTKPVAIKLPDSFPVLMPFRYVEIENSKGDLQLKDFTQIAYFSYWEDNTSHFESSNPILNQVWDLCKYSIKATTFAGLYVDGDRERIPYEADAYLNQLSHYTTDREYAMARQTLEYFMEHPTWPTEWQLHVALMFQADYMYTGNTELIEKYYEDLKHKTLVELKREDGLISSDKATPEFMRKLGFKNPKDKLKDIVDWPPAQKDTGWKLATKEGERDGFVFKPINTVINSLYYRNLEIMAEFAEILGKTDEAKMYEQLAIQVKESINNKLFNASIGAYIDGEGTNHASLHSNMMALAFNIVPEKNIESVVTFIKSRGMACSVYGAQYLLEALYNANESDYALELMTATHDRSWYNMIKIGSTITLEAWDMKYKPNADWNHAWGAAPANIIPRYLWGIQPKTPGYAVAKIKPQLKNLKSSSIVVPTLRGQIKATYILQDKIERYIIDIPANMNVEFVVKPTSKVKVNNEIKSSKLGVIYLEAGNNIVEIIN